MALRDERDRRPNSLRGEFDSPAHHILQIAQPVSVRGLLGNVPFQDELDDAFDLYPQLANRPFRTFAEDGMDRDDPAELYIVGPALTGYELNSVLHFAAPSKKFGRDTGDIQDDWISLWEARYEEILALHRNLPGWKYVEAHKDKLLQIINASSFRSSLFPSLKGQELYVFPVVRLVRQEDGKYLWSLDQPDDAACTKLLQKLEETDEPGELYTALGPAMIAAYSPDVTGLWPKTYRFPDKQKWQNLGATQAFGVTLMYQKSLLRSRFLEKLLSHAIPGKQVEVKTAEEDEETVAMHVTHEVLQIPALTLENNLPPKGVIFDIHDSPPTEEAPFLKSLKKKSILNAHFLKKVKALLESQESDKDSSENT